jgi:DNA-binding beta-propeller fold protein YncE
MSETAVAPGASATRVEFRPAASVKKALSRLGRTEDIRFSPDNRLLAIAGFQRRACLFVRVAIEAGASGPVVVADDFMEITSDGISQVHGVDFIDDRTLAVANRDAQVGIIALPAGEPGGRLYHAPVLRRLNGGAFRRIRTPGSIAVGRLPFGQVALFVCNNYAHRVTRHVCAPRLGYLNWRNQVLLRRGLEVPDGIAVSGDGRWLAVSSHATRDVKIFDASAPLGPDVEPVGSLGQLGYPHGLRFTADDRHLVVADAASPNLHVYDRGESWMGPRDPVRSVAVLDRETFLRGRNNPEEGGPKGLDVDRTGTLLAITCEEERLALFTLPSVLGTR